MEQKNATLVRAYVGYDRLDNMGQCMALNTRYDQLWVYYNLFQPVLHLVGKKVVDGKPRRKWDHPDASGLPIPFPRTGCETGNTLCQHKPTPATEGNLSGAGTAVAKSHTRQYN